MSFIDADSLSALDLVTQYVMELRGRGHFITRDESGLIQTWLDLADGQPEVVILILEEILPEKIAKAQSANRKNVTLGGINRTVKKKLEERKLLRV